MTRDSGSEVPGPSARSRTLSLGPTRAVTATVKFGSAAAILPVTANATVTVTVTVTGRPRPGQPRPHCGRASLRTRNFKLIMNHDDMIMS